MAARTAESRERHLDRRGRLVQAIADYGPRYAADYLSQFDATLLVSDPWAGLDFFLSRACFQGRLDTVSERVYQATKQVLEPLLGRGDFAVKLEELAKTDWQYVCSGLEQRIGKGRVGKARDREMVISALTFVYDRPGSNLAEYSAAEIRRGRIVAHYIELQPSRSPGGITQVGPKIASFYLRDLVFLCGLEEHVPAESAFVLQPVDAWVHKIGRKLGIVQEGDSDAEVRDAILEVCRTHEVSVIHFNQGAW